MVSEKYLILVCIRNIKLKKQKKKPNKQLIYNLKSETYVNRIIIT